MIMKVTAETVIKTGMSQNNLLMKYVVMVNSLLDFDFRASLSATKNFQGFFASLRMTCEGASWAGRLAPPSL
jgi:hypothetical protein